MGAVTVSGVNYAKAVDPSGDNILGPGLWGARVRVQFDSYTLASVASGSTIRVAKLPAGARVLAVLLNNAALGTGVTLAVGNGGSGQSAIFAAAAAAHAATTAPKVCQLTAASAYVVGTLTGDDVVTVTTGGATASGAISTAVLYTVD
jgi:hypothetical protein